MKRKSRIKNIKCYLCGKVFSEYDGHDCELKYLKLKEQKKNDKQRTTIN